MHRQWLGPNRSGFISSPQRSHSIACIQKLAALVTTKRKRKLTHLLQPPRKYYQKSTKLSTPSLLFYSPPMTRRPSLRLLPLSWRLSNFYSSRLLIDDWKLKNSDLILQSFQHYEGGVLNSSASRHLSSKPFVTDYESVIALTGSGHSKQWTQGMG